MVMEEQKNVNLARAKELLELAKAGDKKALSDLMDMARGRSDAMGVSFRIDYTLEKFDGEHVPGDGKVPVEIVRGSEINGISMPTTVERC